MHVPCIIHIEALIHPFLGKMMGTNQTGKRFYQVKIKGLDVTSLKELGRLMRPLETITRDMNPLRIVTTNLFRCLPHSSLTQAHGANTLHAIFHIAMHVVKCRVPL